MREFAGPRPSPADRRAGSASRASVGFAGLQATAGNRAVAMLVEQSRPVAQRAVELALPPFTEGFTPQEQDWIDQVWHNPGIQLMFIAYGELPTPVLARVKEITGDPTAEGVIHNEPGPGQADVEIADATYDVPIAVEEEAGTTRAGTEEEEFKATLIHELFHFVENNTKSVDPEAITTPETLKAIMVEPRLKRMAPFSFGWIARGESAVYIEDVEVLEVGLGDDLERVAPDSPEAKALQDKAYEQSPDSRGLEEDLATSIAMYLTGPALQGSLAERYPRRFELVDGYFRTLVKMVTARKG